MIKKDRKRVPFVVWEDNKCFVFVSSLNVELANANANVKLTLH